MKFIKKYRQYIFIFFVWIIFSSPFLFKGFVPFPSTYLVSFFPPWSAYHGMAIKNNAMPDIITQIFPWKHLTIESWKRGEIPLWNPYSFSGTTHAGNYQTAVFSPINILFFIFSFINAWSLSVLLQPLVAGLSMCYFLGVLKKTPEASIIGSLAFMFCGFITTWMGYETLGWAIALLPLSFAGVTKYRESKAWWSGVIVSFSVTFSLLSGHYQISFYFLVALVLFILLQSASWRDRLWLILYTMLGVGISLPQLLLTFHAFSVSDRSGSFTSGAIPWSYLFTLFAPDFYGNPVTRNDWFGQYAEWSSTIGVIPLFFAVFASIGKNIKEKKFFLILFFLSILVAMATPVNALVYQLKIPIISTSVATRMIVLVSFSLAVLSAFGFDDLIASWKKTETSKIKKFVAGVLVALSLLWVGILIFNVVPQEHKTIAIRNTILPSLFIVLLVVGIITGFVLKKLQKFVLFGFILLTSFELLRYTGKWMPFDPPEYIYPEFPVISFLQKTIGNDRVYGTFGNELNTYEKIPSIEGYDAVYQARYGEFISASHDGKIGEIERSVVHLDKAGKYSEHILQMLGASYILHRVSDGRHVWAYPFWEYPYYERLYADDKYEVFKNTRALPRAFLASSYVIETEKQQIISKLFSDDLDRSTTLLLEIKPEIDPQIGTGSAKIISYNPNNITISTKSDSPKLLFLSDVYDEGWVAYVNGMQTPILRANYAFRAIALPSGDNQVKFMYQPKEFTYGLYGTLISLFVLAGLSMRKLLYDHRHLHTIS